MRRTLYFIGILCGLFYTNKINYIFQRISCLFYSGLVKRRFKRCESNRLFPTFKVVNPHCIEIGNQVEIKPLCRIEAICSYRGQEFSPLVILSDNSVVNAYCHIGCVYSVYIGKYTTIAERTLITDHTHGIPIKEEMMLPPRHRPLHSKGNIVIEDFVSVGEGVVILGGVTIGHHSIIGANAVITKDIPPYSVVIGNPAKVIKTVL